MPVDCVNFRHRLQHSFCRNGGRLRVVHVRKQHDEFIATLPADGIRGTHTLHQAFCDGLKKFVTDWMAEGIVDVLEPIQIQKRDSDLFHMPWRHGDRIADPV